jgi:hypothetical protein
MSAVSIHISRTQRRALREERHFGLVDGLRFPTWARCNRQGQELGPTQPFLRSPTAIMITCSNSPFWGAGCPIITSVIYAEVALSSATAGRDRKYRGEELVCQASGPDFQEATLHTRMFERKENDLPAHNGSVREDHNCFCQVYAMLRADWR